MNREIHLSYQITEADFVAAAKESLGSSPPVRYLYRVGFAAGPVAGLVLFFILAEPANMGLSQALIWAGISVGLSSIVWLPAWRVLARRLGHEVIQAITVGPEAEIVPERTEIVISDGGIRITRRFESRTIQWAGVQGIRRLNSFLEIEVESGAAVFVPHAAFENAQAAEAFAEELDAMVRRNGTPRPPAEAGWQVLHRQATRQMKLALCLSVLLLALGCLLVALLNALVP